MNVWLQHMQKDSSSPDQPEQYQTKKEFLAHYSCNQFNLGYTKQQKLTYRDYQKNPKKSHILQV